MEEFLKALPATFIPLFVAIDIFWVVPFFAPIAVRMTPEARGTMVSQSVLTAMAVAVLFVILGEAIFGVLGITANDFKVAGGALLFVLAIRDLNRAQKEPLLDIEDSGVVPLGVPLIVGPAVLTTILVLTDHYGILPTLISLGVNLVLTWWFLSNAHRLRDIIGDKFIIALSKIMSILLASIAVMMIRLGLTGMLG